MIKHKTICGVDLSYFAKRPSPDELACIIAGWDSVEQANFFIVLGEEIRNQCAGRHAMQWEHIAVDLCRIEREIVHESGSELLEELAARIPNYRGGK